MQTKCLKSLKITLGIIGTFHLLVGFLALIPFIPKTQLAALVYKATFDPTHQFAHVGEMVGTYMFAIGFMALLALKDPIKNEVVVKGVMVLLGLRLVSILIFSGQEYAVFGIPPFRYWLNFTAIAILLTSLIILRPKPE